MLFTISRCFWKSFTKKIVKRKSPCKCHKSQTHKRDFEMYLLVLDCCQKLNILNLRLLPNQAPQRIKYGIWSNFLCFNSCDIMYFKFNQHLIKNLINIPYHFSTIIVSQTLCLIIGWNSEMVVNKQPELTWYEIQTIL